MTPGGPALGLILDLDRTLLTLPVDIDAVRERLSAWAAPYGVRSPWRPILAELKALPARLSPKLGEGAALVAEQAWALLDAEELRAAGAATACPGAVELVAQCLSRSIPLALVTNNARPAALAALQAVGIDPACFITTVCRRECPSPKPDPEGFRRAFAALSHAGSLRRLVCVGDTVTDVEAARALRAEVMAAGQPTEVLAAAVCTGFASRQQLEGAGPDILLENLLPLWDTL